jgi:hypothetical protein
MQIYVRLKKPKAIAEAVPIAELAE